MQHPYQCIVCINHDSLAAACGSKLLSISSDGIVLSEWSPQEATNAQSNDSDEDEQKESEERPAKKQKTSKVLAKAPNIIRLTISEDSRHVVAVTDDKAIRVFEHSDGRLTELSQRIMPKRPCAIQTLSDEATILCADKFGDVYSLPLIPAAVEEESTTSGAQESTPQPDAKFKVAATNLTVHSQRNRQALEAQMKQKNFTPRKDSLKFQHKLLLGHVSMLTDMKYVVEPNDRRGYFITADRDEHIRVSRGVLSQAHIIEGYCLGHTEFVSKICQVGLTSLLVSGGGDSWLGVWDLQDFKLRMKFDLMKMVRKLPGAHVKKPEYKLSVSGLWSINIDSNRGLDTEQAIVVACEKLKALFVLPRTALEADPAQVEEYENSRELPPWTRPFTILLSHFPLDLTARGDELLVSVDARRNGQKRILSIFLRIRGGGISADGDDDDEEGDPQCETLNDRSASGDACTNKELDALLYGVANLRKRRDWEEQSGPGGEQTPELQVDAAAEE